MVDNDVENLDKLYEWDKNISKWIKFCLWFKPMKQDVYEESYCGRQTKVITLYKTHKKCIYIYAQNVLNQ